MVISVLAIVLGLVTVSMGSLRSSSLSTATRQFADYLNLCRSQAIARHTVIRVGIVVDSSNPDDACRRYSAWAWNKRTREFEQVHEWKRLSRDLVFDPSLPPYIREATYAKRDASAVRGDYWLKAAEMEKVKETGTIRFLEFSPGGRASVEYGDGRNVVILMRNGEREDPSPKPNWSQFNVDTLTGRVRIYRP